MFANKLAKTALMPALVFMLTLIAHYAWFVKTGSVHAEPAGGCSTHMPMLGTGAPVTPEVVEVDRKSLAK